MFSGEHGHALPDFDTRLPRADQALRGMIAEFADFVALDTKRGEGATDC